MINKSGKLYTKFFSWLLKVFICSSDVTISSANSICIVFNESLKLIICFSNRLSKGGSIFIWFNFSCVTNKITLNCLLTSEEVLKLANAILVKYLSAIFI